MSYIVTFLLVKNHNKQRHVTINFPWAIKEGVGVGEIGEKEGENKENGWLLHKAIDL